MTQLLILILAALMIAAAKAKAFAKNIYKEATYKAAEIQKKGGKENE